MASWFKNNFLLTFFGIFALIGTGVGIGAAVTFLHTVEMTNNGVRAVGLVADMVVNSDGRTQAPVVTFKLEDGSPHTYISSIFSSPPAYDIGEHVELWYDPNDPDKVVMSGLDRWFAPMLLGFFFLVFGGLGYGGLIYQLLKKRDRAWLMDNGQEVEAEILGVKRNYNIKVGGDSPFVIKAQWQDKASNKMYTFKSDNIWFDPSEYLQGQTLRVLINPAKPGLYYMDLSFLPEQG